jgi:tripartite ATP-independent transporter DctM subunit
MNWLTPEWLCLIMFLTTLLFLGFGFPVAFTLAGSSILFAFISLSLGFIDTGLLAAVPQQIFAIMTSKILVAVPPFIFMGVMLERSKIAEELLENMGRVFGGKPGGLLFSVTLVGVLLAASTGIVGATVVTMGLLSLPTMMRHNYDRPLALGTIAASGTLGQIIPPSIVLILLGDQLSNAYTAANTAMGNFAADTVSVNDLFAGAMLPGLLLVALYLFYQLIVTRRWPEKAPPIPQEALGLIEGPMWRHILSVLIAPLLLIIAVLGSILMGLASPSEVASIGAFGAVLLAARRLKPGRAKLIILTALSFFALVLLSSLYSLRIDRSDTTLENYVAFGTGIVLTLGLVYGLFSALKDCFIARDEAGNRILVEVMRATLEISTMVFVILIGASLFSLMFIGLRGDEVVADFLKQLPGGTLTAVFLVMLVMFILGFFLDFLEIIFITVPIVGPVLLQMEIAPGILMSPVWLGVMMAINIQTSFLTPPFGFSLFYLRGVAPNEIKTTEIYKGVLPFVAIQLLVLVTLWFFPEIATKLPDYLYAY